MNSRETKLADFIRASLDHDDDSPEVQAALGRLEKKDKETLTFILLMSRISDEVHAERQAGRERAREQAELDSL